MTIDKWYRIRQLVLGWGLSSELWYVTRENKSRCYHFFHLGFVDDVSPERTVKATVLMLTLLIITVRVGFVRGRK